MRALGTNPNPSFWLQLAYHVTVGNVSENWAQFALVLITPLLLTINFYCGHYLMNRQSEALSSLKSLNLFPLGH